MVCYHLQFSISVFLSHLSQQQANCKIMSFFSRSQRLYDITVYGATGYTGRLIAQYLASRVPSELSQPDYVRVALAGRSSDKLEALRVSRGCVSMVKENIYIHMVYMCA